MSDDYFEMKGKAAEADAAGDEAASQGHTAANKLEDAQAKQKLDDDRAKLAALKAEESKAAPKSAGREFVTQSSRFYCVSMKSDICKTPMGASTPPIPYTIMGEFSQATGVSPNIKSNSEPVVINASTVIPTVTGDGAGSAKGIKSGTVGKRVQHDKKSKTTTFNGQKAIREGDTVWMNDKNTNAKIQERGGQAAKPRIAAGTATAPPEKSFGDKFDDAAFAAADKINAGKEWLGGKVNDLAQTSVGGKALKGLEWVSEKTELTGIKNWKEGLASNAQSAAEGIGGRGAGIIGALTVGALQAIPTSLLDVVPGGGKAAGAASKTAAAAGKLEKTAAEAAKLGSKAEDAASAASKTERAAGGAGKPPKDGQDGGKSKKARPTKDPCAHLKKGDAKGKGEYRGGGKAGTSKPGYESHHMPADSATKGSDDYLGYRNGPAIQMKPEDHEKTSSNGKMKGHAKYIQSIKDLLRKGKYRDAMAKEVKDVRRVAREIGDSKKYNEATQEMLQYAKCKELLNKRSKGQ